MKKSEADVENPGMVLERMTGNPMIALNRAVAAAMVHGPQAGLELLRPLEKDARL